MDNRVAILVIHGMGAQKPYQTLDQFARGVQNSLPMAKKGEYSRELRLRQHDEDPAHQQKAWTQAFVRLTPSGDRSGLQPAPELIDLVEYYWAPIINDRVSALQSLRFLIFSALSPFDYLRSNMLVINEVTGQTSGAASQLKREDFSNSATKQILFVLWREVWRTVLIFFPFILLLTGLYCFTAQPLLKTLLPPSSSTWLSYFWAGNDPNWGDAIVLALVALRWLLIGMTLKYLWDALRHPEATTPDQKRPVLLCNLAVIAVLLVLLALPFVLHGIFHFQWPGGLARGDSFSHPCLEALVGSLSMALAKIGRYLHCNLFFAPLSLRLIHLSIYAGLALLSYWINLFLTTAIGGLSVYLGSDTLSKNFAARSQILSECTATVESLLGKQPDLPADNNGVQQYDRVLIAAHSLGSVIAYDLVNDLIAKHEAGNKTAGLERITGLFTFGCPLNKTYYFFRTRTEEKTTVLNDILFKLHNFRLRVPSPAGAQPTPSPFSEKFCWFNAWSPFDVISGRMLFYQADQNRKVTAGYNPVTAHTGYWEDPDLYLYFSDLL
jgi:hypothetical protein